VSRTSIGRRLRTQALADAGGRCGYCLSSEEITGAPLEIEHLIPEARGGPTRRSNLWAACRQCNALKSDQVEAIDPETGTSEPLFNPGTSAGRSTSCGVTREIVSLGGTRHRSECPCP
jgi:5-methylcytosine-specific restriction endonuclease McrA